MEIALIVFFIGLTNNNLICNGDFEGYIFNNAYKGDPYVLKGSDPNCWYNQDNGLIQIKSKASPLTTKAAELTSIYPYTLCQKVNLVPGRQYSLQYTLFCPAKLTQMLLQVKLNQVQISTLYIANQNTFGANSVIVNPSEIINQFCFSETHVASIFDAFDGGFLDNITLTELISTQISIIVSNQTENSSVLQQNNSSNLTILQNSNQNYAYDQIIRGFNQNDVNDFINSPEQARFKLIVYLKTQVKQLAWEIHLVSDILFKDYLIYSLSEKISLFSIFLEGQLQKQSYPVQNQAGMTVLIIKIHRNYDINTLEVMAENTQNAEQLVDFQVYLDNKKIHFHLLNQNQKKVIENLQPVAQIMPQFVFKLYQIISSSLCSYFILSLFNFWNLSLMYNFLLIDNVPNFTRNIYEIMINLLYQKGSVIEWLTKSFNISEDAFDLREWRDLPEKMEDYKKGFSWFGMFGFSSIALINNLDTFFILLVLMFKLILLKVVIQCISKKVRKTLGLPKRLSPFFMLQLIAAVPFILISSVVAVSSSADSPRQLVQKCLQTIFLFGCVSIVPLWLASNFQNIKDIKRDLNKLKAYHKLDHSMRIKKKISDRIQNLSSELIQQRVSLNYNFLELILNLTIPGLIWLGNAEGFLTVNTLVIIGRSVYFYRKMRKMRILDRFFGFMMTTIWLIHHFNYCAFYVLSVLRQNSIGDTDIISEAEVYCGIMAFLTVLTGGGIEILRFVCQIIAMIFGLVHKIKQLCKLKKKENQIEPKQNPGYPSKIQTKDNLFNQQQQKIEKSRQQQVESEKTWITPVKIIYKKGLRQNKNLMNNMKLQKTKKYIKKSRFKQQPKVKKIAQNKKKTIHNIMVQIEEEHEF